MKKDEQLLKEYIKHLIREFNAAGGGAVVGFGLLPAFYPGNKKKKKAIKTKNR